ncbi:hypothetical protein CQ015_01410 [Arthrobacter sp. MYb221]|nr:hypothetical protein CQ015_01410 [Arthrobacter sp. MYb221]
MPYRKRRSAFLYIISAFAIGVSLHAFFTEGFGVTSVIPILLAIVFSWEATKHLRNGVQKTDEEKF